MTELELQKKIMILSAKDEIRELMNAYQNAMAQGCVQGIYDRFWSSREDTCVEVGASGEFIGSYNAGAYYQKDILQGVFSAYVVGNPVISVAEDGQSAEGVWTGVGVELDAGELTGGEAFADERRKLWTSETECGKKYRAENLMVKLLAKFVLEDGAWKFLRLQILELLRAPAKEDFVSWAEARFDTDGIRLEEQFHSNQPFPPDRPPERMADEPTTCQWQYTWEAFADQLP